MTPFVKSTFVVIGLFAFCGIAVIGPSLENGIGSLASTAMGSTKATAIGNRKMKANKDYAQGGPMHAAMACCEKCDSSWDFEGDRCVLISQADTACYTRCGK